MLNWQYIPLIYHLYIAYWLIIYIYISPIPPIKGTRKQPLNKDTPSIHILPTHRHLRHRGGPSTSTVEPSEEIGDTTTFNKLLVGKRQEKIKGEIPSRKLTYPTLGSSENHLQHAIFGGYVRSLGGVFGERY